MKTIATSFLLSTVFLSSCAQTKTHSITDKEMINVEKLTTNFDVQNYFEDKDLLKKGEYTLKRKKKIVIRKDEAKDIIDYYLVLHSQVDTLATFGSLAFTSVEGFTNNDNAFFGLVFRNYQKLNDTAFKEKIDVLQQLLGKPNFQFKDQMRDLTSKKLYSWKIKNLIYVAYLDYQDWLRLHIINADKFKEIDKTELGWKLIDL
ncbi:hypothetical protein [Pedobacter sp.]|uniref:hypothetical protein n=1 Tax=Pedobacter sp. TaxID=1411316 RepID=UPI003BAC291C